MPELNLEVPKRYIDEFIMRAKEMSAVVVAEHLTD
jgi:hypothetical protein